MKFGVREICDVTFKTTAAGQKVGNTVFERAGMPAFSIDTAKTSSLEQATTTVYAQGGKGYNRLIAWEGEKTMTFTVEDALISPMGLAVLSGAGLIKADKQNLAHVHITIDANLDSNGVATVGIEDLQEETGLTETKVFDVCKSTAVPVYATVIDGSGAGIEFVDGALTVGGGETSSYDNAIKVTKDKPVTFTVPADKVEAYKNKTVKLDFYLIMASGVTEVEIKPNDFGGFFYVEAQTLYRREDTGLDMAAEIIIPKVKVQSGFTFSMAASGDPSTFTFTMDAFPGYTMFDRTKKVMCVMQIIGTDNTSLDSQEEHTHPALITGTASKPLTVPADSNVSLSQANQDMVTITQTDTDIFVKVADGETLNEYELLSGNIQETGKWIAIAIETGDTDITKVTLDGVAFDKDDVLLATSMGAPMGSFILWVDADALPKTFILGGEGKKDKTFTVKLLS